MKKTILAVLSVLLLATAVVGEPALKVRPKAVGARISTVAQLQGLRLTSQPTKVMSGQLNGKLVPMIKGNLNLAAVHAASSAVHKTGSGVVLKPTSMTDPTTKSQLTIMGAFMDQKLVDSVTAKNDAPISIMCPAGQHANLGFLFAEFRNLPAGKHLYMLTLRANMKIGVGDYLTMSIGSTYVAPSGFTTMGDDRHTLVTFDPGSGDNTLQVSAKINMPQDDKIAFIDVSYLQLAQID